MPITKVLVANRGEIAVRVIRAARDSGLGSVAVMPIRMPTAVRETRDEASAPQRSDRQRPIWTGKILDVAARTGDAVHPGYGFLAENADFARAVIDAGLT